jgi:hypothetical protein
VIEESQDLAGCWNPEDQAIAGQDVGWQFLTGRLAWESWAQCMCTWSFDALPLDAPEPESQNPPYPRHDHSANWIAGLGRGMPARHSSVPGFQK